MEHQSVMDLETSSPLSVIRVINLWPEIASTAFGPTVQDRRGITF
jgi:hypothetical protein